MIPESFIQELKYYSDIEQIISSYVHLTRRGRNLVGLCPFHSEKTPSFTVYPDNQSFYCFGCGAGGDVVTFVRRAENLEYVEALRFLAEKCGMAMPEEVQDDGAAMRKTRILEINREAARMFHRCLLSAQGEPGRRYLAGRQLSEKTIRHFGLGYAPEGWDFALRYLRGKGYSEQDLLDANLILRGRSGRCFDQFRGRVIFPIIDLRGNVIAFGGRILGEGGPKYLNSGDTPVFKKSRNLFAMNFAKNTKESSFILAEGYMDVIAIHQAGFDNAVATLGTSLTQEQARLIAQYCQQVVIAYDSDGAGQTATQRAIRLFGDTGVRVSVLSIPDAKDPDEYLKKYGATRFKLLLEGSAGAVDFEIEKLRRKHDLAGSEGRVAFLKEFASLMAGIPSPVERDVYIGKIADELSVSRDALTLQVANTYKRRKREYQKKEERALHNEQTSPLRSKDLQRSANLRYANAEEKLIAALLKNPDLYPQVAARIRPEQFVTDFNRELFALLCQRLQKQQSLELIALSAFLTPEQMAAVSWMTASSQGLTIRQEAVEDYIHTILEHEKIRTETQVAQMGTQELGQYIKSLVANKNRGK